MSVVIVGGNDCMVRRYKDLCKQYDCQAKVFTQMKDGLKNKIGCPDLLVLFLLFVPTPSRRFFRLQ